MTDIERVERVARAIEDQMASDDNMPEDLARAALTAIAPEIRRQALEEAASVQVLNYPAPIDALGISAAFNLGVKRTQCAIRALIAPQAPATVAGRGPDNFSQAAVDESPASATRRVVEITCASAGYGHLICRPGDDGTILIFENTGENTMQVAPIPQPDAQEG